MIDLIEWFATPRDSRARLNFRLERPANGRHCRRAASAGARPQTPAKCALGHGPPLLREPDTRVRLIGCVWRRRHRTTIVITSLVRFERAEHMDLMASSCSQMCTEQSCWCPRVLSGATGRQQTGQLASFEQTKQPICSFAMARYENDGNYLTRLLMAAVRSCCSTGPKLSVATTT